MTGVVAETLKVWALVAVNFLGFFLGAVLTALSFHAYRSGDPNPSLRNATIGFGLLTLGTAVEPIYQVGVEGTHVLASDQNVSLQLIEGTLISVGLLVLFFSIYRYQSASRRRTVTVSGVDDDLFDDVD